MSAPVRPPAPVPLRGALLKAIDWRTVAAIGLPLWAFLIGVVLARPPAPEPVLARLAPPFPPGAPEPQAAAPEVTDAVPMPREIVIRTRVTAVPVLVPVAAPAEPVAVAAPAPAEFRLPASEIVPAERCQTFNTKVRFHPGLPEAADEATSSKKMLLVLHISGHFDDPGFT